MHRIVIALFLFAILVGACDGDRPEASTDQADDVAPIGAAPGGEADETATLDAAEATVTEGGAPETLNARTCLGPDRELVTWGDFIVTSDVAAVDVPANPPLVSFELVDAAAADQPGAQLFPNIASAEAALPASVWVPRLDAVPEGFAEAAVIATFDGGELVEIQTWYDRRAPDALRAVGRGSPALLVAHVRYFALPQVHEATAGPAAVADFIAEPARCVVVGDRPGIALEFTFDDDEIQFGRTILDAVQWTEADGSWWTVQAVASTDELTQLAAGVQQAWYTSAGAPPR
jgi:hypothetical protein